MEKPRPSIAVIYSGDPGPLIDPNAPVRAFATFARENGFRVTEIDPSTRRFTGKPDFIEHRLRQDASDGLLAMIATPGHRSGYVGYEARQFRSDLQIQVPIFGLHDWRPDKNIVDLGDNTHIAYPFSADFLQTLEILRDTNPGVHVQMLRHITQHMDVLLKAHTENFPEMDVDDNTRIVLAYLRWGAMVYPNDARTEEFDSTLSEKAPLDQPISTEYENDWRKLKELSKRARSKLSGTIIESQGERRRATMNGGYAIDPETLIDIKLFGYGTHKVAPVHLEKTVSLYLRGAGKESGFRHVDSYRNFVTGFLLGPTKPFNTPFVILDNILYMGLPLEQAIRVVEKIANEKAFIPVTSGGEIIDAEFLDNYYTESSQE